MKIAFFTDTYFPQVNGVTYAINQFKKEIEKTKSNSVYIFYPSSEYKPGVGEISLLSLPFPFYKSYKVALSWKKIPDRDFDIVHLHGLYGSAVLGIVLAKALRIPLVATYHTPTYLYTEYLIRWLPMFAKKPINILLKKIVWWWEKRVLKRCDLVLAPSQAIVDFLEARGVKNVKYLPNGIDLSKFKHKQRKSGKKVIGYVGRLGFEKHLEDLINIADKFDGDILIIGDGPAKNHYKKLAKYKSNVNFLGFVEHKNLTKIYNSIDFLINPSTVETQSLTAIEAMACGTPVIGAAALALTKTISHGKTGFLYEPGNTSDLLEKISKAYQKKDFLSRNCINEVKNYNIKQTTKQLLNIYFNLKKCK